MGWRLCAVISWEAGLAILPDACLRCRQQACVSGCMPPGFRPGLLLTPSPALLPLFSCRREDTERELHLSPSTLPGDGLRQRSGNGDSPTKAPYLG